MEREICRGSNRWLSYWLVLGQISYFTFTIFFSPSLLNKALNFLPCGLIRALPLWALPVPSELRNNCCWDRALPRKLLGGFAPKEERRSCILLFFQSPLAPPSESLPSQTCLFCQIWLAWGSLPGFCLVARQVAKCSSYSLMPISPLPRVEMMGEECTQGGKRPKEKRQRGANGQAVFHRSAPGLPVHLALLLWVL